MHTGMGHILSRPRMMRTAMEHNVAWFDEHLFSQANVSVTPNR